MLQGNIHGKSHPEEGRRQQNSIITPTPYGFKALTIFDTLTSDMLVLIFSYSEIFALRHTRLLVVQMCRGTCR